MHVIEFSEDGKAECLHTDGFPLAELGRLSMERASTIEFNDRTQRWEVRMLFAGGKPGGGMALCISTSRAECLAWEREHFNGLILNR